MVFGELQRTFNMPESFSFVHAYSQCFLELDTRCPREKEMWHLEKRFPSRMWLDFKLEKERSTGLCSRLYAAMKSKCLSISLLLTSSFLLYSQVVPFLPFLLFFPCQFLSFALILLSRVVLILKTGEIPYHMLYFTHTHTHSTRDILHWSAACLFISRAVDVAQWENTWQVPVMLSLVPNITRERKYISQISYTSRFETNVKYISNSVTLKLENAP